MLVVAEGRNERTKESKNTKCVFRFAVSLPYQTKLAYFRGVGSPIDDVPLNIKPYINKLKQEWMENYLTDH